MTEILDKAKQWLTSTFDAETQKEINELKIVLFNRFANILFRN